MDQKDKSQEEKKQDTPKHETPLNEDNLDNDLLKEDIIQEELSEEKEDNKSTSEDKTAEELSDMKDKYLRLYAEFDNYRKRTLREREELIKTAAEGTIKAILPTLDDFERAIKAAKAGNDDNSIIEGIVLIYEKLLRSLEQQGLKVMESDGQAFDPDLHEALTKVPSPNDDMKGKVFETIEKGYYLREKIIRYAKVVVGQ